METATDDIILIIFIKKYSKWTDNIQSMQYKKCKTD